MSWERRGKSGEVYYYHCRRAAGGTVVKVYLGLGAWAGAGAGGGAGRRARPLPPRVPPGPRRGAAVRAGRAGALACGAAARGAGGRDLVADALLRRGRGPRDRRGRDAAAGAVSRAAAGAGAPRV